MKASSAQNFDHPGRSRRTLTLDFLLTLLACGSVHAQQGTPEQRKACTPDVYRLCARDSERPGDHLMSASAEGQPEPGLRGGVRTVSSITFPAPPGSLAAPA